MHHRFQSSATEPTALIVILRMESSAAERFSALRRRHFPAERNWLDAHITLFHRLPVSSLDTVLGDSADLAAGGPGFPLCVERLLFLGVGVAYALTSVQATDLRIELAARWAGLLGQQDRNWRGPLHVTVQNKVTPSSAKMLEAKLKRDFVPYEIAATGLQVWYYVGGPWRHIATFPFKSA